MERPRNWFIETKVFTANPNQQEIKSESLCTNYCTTESEKESQISFEFYKCKAVVILFWFGFVLSCYCFENSFPSMDIFRSLT